MGQMWPIQGPAEGHHSRMASCKGQGPSVVLQAWSHGGWGRDQGATWGALLSGGSWDWRGSFRQKGEQRTRLGW